MYKYNDSTATTRWLCICAGLLAGVMAAGCVSPPPPAPEPTAVNNETTTRLPAPPAPDSQPISDRELRRAVRDDAPLRYVVQPGDTLWDIADYFMVKPWYWPELWYDNPEIDNPHLIYPGDVLILTHVNRRPRIKLSPRVRERPVEKPIPTIPAKAIDVLLNAPRLVTQQQLKQAPYIVAFRDRHLLAGERMTAFVRGLGARDPARLDIVRPDSTLIDPETGQHLGILALQVGRLAVARRGEAVATAPITHSELAARPGDRLLPVRTRVQVSRFRLRLPRQRVEGEIIATYGSSTIVGQYDVVVINRGARHGLERGHLLKIYQAPRTVTDPVKDDQVTLPPQRTGVLMLFDVNKQTSMGIILEATHAVSRLDTVRAPGSR